MAFNIAGAAALAQLAHSFFKFPVAVIKRLTKLQRVKPLDCESCLAFWFGGAAAFGYIPEWAIFAGWVVLAQRVYNRLILF